MDREGRFKAEVQFYYKICNMRTIYHLLSRGENEPLKKKVTSYQWATNIIIDLPFHVAVRYTFFLPREQCSAKQKTQWSVFVLK